MTTLYSIKFYEENTNKFEGKRGIITPEEDLSHKLKGINKEDFSEEHYVTIVKVFAHQIAENIHKQLIESKEKYTRVRNNPNCLGYTSAIQTTQETYRIVTVFEYNCYKLSKFKKKYGIS